MISSMYFVYVFRLCISSMYFVYVFRLCISSTFSSMISSMDRRGKVSVLGGGHKDWLKNRWIAWGTLKNIEKIQWI
jgi:hypothetical protein